MLLEPFFVTFDTLAVSKDFSPAVKMLTNMQAEQYQEFPLQS